MTSVAERLRRDVASAKAQRFGVVPLLRDDGVVLRHDGPLVMCESGLHASVLALDASAVARNMRGRRPPRRQRHVQSWRSLR